MKKIKKIKIKYFYLFWIFLFFSCSNFQKTTEFHFRLQASSQILALNQSSKVSFYFQAQLFKFNKLIKKSEKININSNPDLKFRSLGSGEYKIRVFYYAEFDEKIYSLFYQQSKDIDLDDNSGNNQLDIGQTEGHNQFDDDKDGLNNWFEIRSQFSNNKWLISHPGNEDSDGDGLKDNIDRTPGSAEEDGDKIPENSNDKIISSCRSGQKENCLDNCPGINNLDQKDMDSDGIGDSCDRDLDGDGICNPLVSRLRCQEETKSLFRGINDGDNDNDFYSDDF